MPALTASSLYDMLGQFAEDILAALEAAKATVAADVAAGLTPERVLVQPYSAVADDIGEDCGQLAVVLDSLYRSTDFPAPEMFGQPRPCGCVAAEPVAVMRARLTRCVSGPNDDGTPPSAADLTAEAAVALIDAVALFDGACTFAQRFHSHLSGSVVGVGPEGMAGAYEITVTVPPTDYIPPTP